MTPQAPDVSVRAAATYPPMDVPRENHTALLLLGPELPIAPYLSDRVLAQYSRPPPEIGATNAAFRPS